MAKLNAFIMGYAEVFTNLEIRSENGTLTKNVTHRFLRLFRKIDDPRMPGMIEYPLEEILLIAFLAVLGNADTWLEIEDFGRAKERWLRKFMRLKNGIPSHDTFRRVLSLIDSEQLQKTTVELLMENLNAIKRSLESKIPSQDIEKRLICVDGKEQKGTGRLYNTDEKIRNLQTLHVYDASNEICLFSKAIDEKTNEIPVAQKILSSMNLKDCIVTFDALHTQKETISIIRSQKGDYVGGLKGNQNGLLEEAAGYFEEQDLLAHYKKKGDYFKKTEKAHNRIETREFYLIRPIKSKIIKEWKALKAFICCVKTSVSKTNPDDIKKEIRYYIASFDDIELCAEAIRGHWKVENNLHWHLDYSFHEDENTTMDKIAFNNLSLLRKMALSICKMAKELMGNSSIRSTRKKIGWMYEDAIADILSTFDEKTIMRSLETVKR